jgi:DNA-binding MarR family transcriptional regulator
MAHANGIQGTYVSDDKPKVVRAKKATSAKRVTSARPVVRKRAALRNPELARERADKDVISRDLQRLIERFPLWRRPGYLVRRLHQLHHDLFLNECGAFDITPVQYGLMTVLHGRPDGDQQTLAAEVGLDRTNVADVLARLERRGIVKRHQGLVDRRTVVARLTSKGERITKQMHAAMSRAQERLLSPFDKAEQELFIKMMLRVIDANNQFGRAVLASPPRQDSD